MSLVLDSLTKRFGPVTALDGISFSVERGEVFGFLGANGAGKTTTMRIILDILRARLRARSTWDGTPSTDVPRRTWGYLPEERGLYPRLEVLEQLVFFASLYAIPRKEAAAARPGLAGPLPDPGVREAPRRGAVEGQPAEGPAHRGDPPRARRPDHGRAVRRPRPGQRLAPQGGVRRDAQARHHAHLLDPPDGDGRGAVRGGRDHRPGPTRPRRPDPRRPALDRPAGRPARGRRRRRRCRGWPAWTA